MKAIPIALGAVVLAASLGVTFVLYQRYGMAELGYGVRSYAIESDSRVQVQFEVAKDPARTAICTVRARDGAGTEVGSQLVTVGPAADRTVVVTHELTTSGRANTGEVTACALQPTTRRGSP